MATNIRLAVLPLFLLAACSRGDVPVPTQVEELSSPQVIEVTQTAIQPEPTATVATGEEPGEPYPTSPSGFILGTGGSTQETMERLIQLAPQDVERELAFYSAEIAREGMSAANFEFVPNLLEGCSWVIVPRNTQTGNFWIPRLDLEGNQIIVASLHLFDFLDRGVDDDFFDLIEVEMPGTQQLVADESCWHVVAGFNEEGDLISWYVANSDEVYVEGLVPTELFRVNSRGQIQEWVNRSYFLVPAPRDDEGNPIAGVEVAWDEEAQVPIVTLDWHGETKAVAERTVNEDGEYFWQVREFDLTLPPERISEDVGFMLDVYRRYASTFDLPDLDAEPRRAFPHGMYLTYLAPTPRLLAVRVGPEEIQALVVWKNGVFVVDIDAMFIYDSANLEVVETLLPQEVTAAAVAELAERMRGSFRSYPTFSTLKPESDASYVCRLWFEDRLGVTPLYEACVDLPSEAKHERFFQFRAELLSAGVARVGTDDLSWLAQWWMSDIPKMPSIYISTLNIDI